MPDRGPDTGLAKRAWRSAALRLRAAGVRAGILDYRPSWDASVDVWASQYAAGDWDYLSSLDELPRFSLIAGYVARFGGNTGASILDIGCGAGTMREHIGHVAFGSYTGVDPVAGAIRSARRLEDDRTSFLVGDAFSDELERYDVVIASEMLYYVPDPAATVDRMGELLAPDGHLIASIHRHPGASVLDRLVDARLELVGGAEVSNVPGGSRRRNRWRVTCHAGPAGRA